MDNFEKFIYNIKSGVENTAKAAMQKSNDIMTITKLKYEIGAAQSAIEDSYLKIGQMVYDMKKDAKDADSIQENVNAMCEEITTHYDKIRKIKEELANFKQCKRCPKCGKENDHSAIFCNSCGFKFDDHDLRHFEIEIIDN